MPPLREGPATRKVSEMNQYDPEVAPDAPAWLALDEAARMQLTEAFHRDTRVRLERSARKLHAAVHAIVETQLATAHDPAVRALERLMADGLTRHDAVHAIGNVVAQHVHGVMQGREGERPSREAYDRQLEELNGTRWREILAQR